MSWEINEADNTATLPNSSFYCQTCQRTHNDIYIERKYGKYHLFQGPHMTKHDSFELAKDYLMRGKAA